MKSGTKICLLFKPGACALLVVIVAISAHASSYPNMITFSNRSGNGALVKLMRPVRMNVGVSNGTQSTYSQGDPFEVVQTPTQCSVITITLHTVVNGNYHVRPASSDDFDRN